MFKKVLSVLAMCLIVLGVATNKVAYAAGEAFSITPAGATTVPTGSDITFDLYVNTNIDISGAQVRVTLNGLSHVVGAGYEADNTYFRTYNEVVSGSEMTNYFEIALLCKSSLCTPGKLHVGKISLKATGANGTNGTATIAGEVVDTNRTDPKKLATASATTTYTIKATVTPPVSPPNNPPANPPATPPSTPPSTPPASPPSSPPTPSTSTTRSGTPTTPSTTPSTAVVPIQPTAPTPSTEIESITTTQEEAVQMAQASLLGATYGAKVGKATSTKFVVNYKIMYFGIAMLGSGLTAFLFFFLKRHGHHITGPITHKISY